MAEGTIRKKEEVQQLIDKGMWEAITWSEIWDRNAKQYPNDEAIVDFRRRLTWKQAKHVIDRLTLGFIDLGYNKDDVIVIQLPGCAEMLLARIACERCGLIAAPVLRSFREADMMHVLELTEAKGLVIPYKYGNFDYFNMIQSIRSNLPKLKHIFVAFDDEIPEGCISLNKMLEEPIERKYSLEQLMKLHTERRMPCTEVSLLCHTTGSTGFPKFAEWSAATLVEEAKDGAKKMGFTHQSVVAAFLPGHGGLTFPVYNWSVLLGAKMVILDKWDPAQALELIEREKVTYFPAVPTIMRQLLDYPDFDKYSLSSLQLIMLSGAFVPAALCIEAEKKTGAKVMAEYGSRDIGNTACPTCDDPAEVRWFTVGKQTSWMEIKLINDDGKEVSQGETGELLVRTALGSSGYFRNPEASTAAFRDKFFYTGDLVRLDKEGNLVIMGRKKNIIIRGGENIYPGEIENLLDTHPKVAKSALVKMPDPLMGERACVYVAVKPGEQFTFDEMTSFLKEKKLASFKIPERLEVVEKIPMIGDGTKVDLKGLESDIANKLKAEGKIMGESSGILMQI